MIEDEKLGLKIAVDPKEALLESTIAQTEKMILSAELELDIHRVVLAFLKGKKLNSSECIGADNGE